MGVCRADAACPVIGANRRTQRLVRHGLELVWLRRESRRIGTIYRRNPRTAARIRLIRPGPRTAGNPGPAGSTSASLGVCLSQVTNMPSRCAAIIVALVLRSATRRAGPDALARHSPATGGAERTETPVPIEQQVNACDPANTATTVVSYGRALRGGRHEDLRAKWRRPTNLLVCRV